MLSILECSRFNFFRPIYFQLFILPLIIVVKRTVCRIVDCTMFIVHWYFFYSNFNCVCSYAHVSFLNKYALFNYFVVSIINLSCSETIFFQGCFPCYECGKPFTTVRGRIDHMVIHTGARNYVCRLCGKSYANRSGLWKHNKTQCVINMWCFWQIKFLYSLF